ncbi:hypothetical protein SEVIR_5G104601v4 [Setaria viridis]|uniref:Uncharacterized protein n=1 Tax=Setaria viridis TaxID=4556 RepID=A0A4V6D695_SETVI|nr:uncharacterized protein LOC117855972 [Setaria viridis]TKW13496.1 hypothetical protein SEVIR_5G104601v2 [Setaria viridis]
MRASSTSMSSGNIEGGNIGDVYKMSISGMYQLATPAEIKHGDMAVEEDEKEWRLDERDKALMVPNLTWEKKVLRVLHMVRCRELIEFNHKLNYSTPTRFCEFNIAFFDLDKESEVMHGPLFYDIPESD